MTRSAGEVPKHGPSTTGGVRFQPPWLEQLTYTATVQVELASKVAGRGPIYCCAARYSELEIFLGGVWFVTALLRDANILHYPRLPLQLYSMLRNVLAVLTKHTSSLNTALVVFFRC
jgi:hypothetical protein